MTASESGVSMKAGNRRNDVVADILHGIIEKANGRSLFGDLKCGRGTISPVVAKRNVRAQEMASVLWK